MSTPAPNSTPTPTAKPNQPTADQLLRAAEMKAEGYSWAAIGKDLDLLPATAQRWRTK